MSWCNKIHQSFEELEKDYIKFLNIRFEKQKQIIVDNLIRE